ncbi:MAG: 4Fe-4S dicluster domain-containing protein [Myxococcota bacterium]
MTNPSPRYGMAFDLERCTGCHACSVACKVENHVPLGHFRTKVYYRDKGTFPRVVRQFLPVVCQQCEDAPCVTSCPTRSIQRGADGVVRINKATCDGTGACEDACPYGAIYVDPASEVADKCDFCSHRVAVGMEPACVETCPGGTIIFGDLNDPASRISAFRRRYDAELTPLKPDKGTKPQVVYRGVDRDLERKVPEGRNHDPRSYEIETWALLQANFDPPSRKG